MDLKEIEKSLIIIYKEVLDTDKIRTTDNLFDLGLDSIKCMISIVKVKERFNLQMLNTVVIFKCQSIKSLAKYIYCLKTEVDI